MGRSDQPSLSLAFYALNGMFTRSLLTWKSHKLLRSILLQHLKPQSALQVLGSADWAVGLDDNGAAASSKEGVQRVTLAIYYGLLAEHRRPAKL